jgi:hypothetical protein
MSLAGQWNSLGSELPVGWSTVDLRLELRDREATATAASLLGPAQPFRAEPTALRFSSARDGTALGPDGVLRLLRRLDDARIVGTLTLTRSQQAVAPVEREVLQLAESFDRVLAAIPVDWSHLFCEIELLSSDYIEPAAVLCIQMNPRRDGNRSALRFRSARVAGYGVAPEMARRCLERCDAADIRGSVRLLQVVCDQKLVATQGPVWLLGGKTV